jgi:anaerobic magnesium-protoporphyrin IX monomethyl ester cyclase
VNYVRQTKGSPPAAPSPDFADPPTRIASSADARRSLSAENGGPVLLAHSYFLRYDAKQQEKMKPYPPLATLIAAAVLRQRGFDVRLFDAMLSEGTEAFERRLAEVRPRLVGIFEDNFNFLTKMCTERMREAALQMIRAARAAGARVAVNGSDATDRPELYLAAGADAVILGEVEATACDLFERWSNDPDAKLSEIPGLVLSGANGGLLRSPFRAGAHDLDLLPLPAWDLVDVVRYRSAWVQAHGRFSWNAATSRGCPYGCNWCAKPVFGRRYVQRSPDSVAAELAHLRAEIGPDHVWFADDIFGLTASWIERFADAVVSMNAVVPFMMQSRANLMEPRVTRALRKAGCEEVWLGVESGSQRILDAMDKGTRIAQVRDATRNLRTDGIKSGWFVQLGYPGETWEDILLTRDLIRDERPDDVGVSVAYPLPGTTFYERVKDQLGARRNWVDSDDLAMLFQGTYETGFYRQVRELIHAEVREVPPGAKANGHLDRRWATLAGAEARHRSRHPTVA